MGMGMGMGMGGAYYGGYSYVPPTPEVALESGFWDIASQSHDVLYQYDLPLSESGATYAGGLVDEAPTVTLPTPLLPAQAAPASPAFSLGLTPTSTSTPSASVTHSTSSVLEVLGSVFIRAGRVTERVELGPWASVARSFVNFAVGFAVSQVGNETSQGETEESSDDDSFDEQKFLRLLEAIDPRVFKWWTTLEPRYFPAPVIERINAKGQNWPYFTQWFGGALTWNIHAYITPEHGVVLRVDKSFTEMQVAMLVVKHARHGAFHQDVQPGEWSDHVGFSFFTGVYDYNLDTNAKDVREATITRAKLAIGQIETLITCVYGGINEGADFVFTLADAMENGVKPEHALAMLPLVSVGGLKTLKGFVDIGGGVMLRYTDELADALRKIPESKLEEVFKKARAAKNGDEAYAIIIQAAKKVDAQRGSLSDTTRLMAERNLRNTGKTVLGPFNP
jgi:hypothetical protein